MDISRKLEDLAREPFVWENKSSVEETERTLRSMLFYDLLETRIRYNRATGRFSGVGAGKTLEECLSRMGLEGPDTFTRIDQYRYAIHPGNGTYYVKVPDCVVIEGVSFPAPSIRLYSGMYSLTLKDAVPVDFTDRDMTPMSVLRFIVEFDREVPAIRRFAEGLFLLPARRKLVDEIRQRAYVPRMERLVTGLPRNAYRRITWGCRENVFRVTVTLSRRRTLVMNIPYDRFDELLGELPEIVREGRVGSGLYPYCYISAR